MPQFIPRDAPIVRSVLLLTTVHVGLALTWHLVWAAAGGCRARWHRDARGGCWTWSPRGCPGFLAVKVLMGGA